MAATQTDVDALKATVDGYGAILTKIQTDFSGIEAKLAAAIAANPGVDLSALQASVSAFSTQLAGAQTGDDTAAQ